MRENFSIIHRLKAIKAKSFIALNIIKIQRKPRNNRKMSAIRLFSLTRNGKKNSSQNKVFVDVNK